MHKNICRYGTPFLRLLATLAMLSGMSLAAQDKILNIADLVKLQNPAFYTQLIELKNSKDLEAGAAVSCWHTPVSNQKRS